MITSKNPTLLQSCPEADAGTTPLILLHDGGGTICSYHCLGPLGRPVYGIHNPRFYSGRPWAGGIPEMAKTYVDLIKTSVPPGKVLLGGWSLGGLVSLQVANELAEDETYDVIGIVMVDCLYPQAFRESTQHAQCLPTSPVFTPAAKADTRMLVARCMKKSAEMVEQWDMPRWGSTSSASSSDSQTLDPDDKHDDSTDADDEHGWTSSQCSTPASGSNGSNSSAVDTPPSAKPMAAPQDLSDALHSLELDEQPPPPPPTVLLRCDNFVPVPEKEKQRPDAVVRVDAKRESSLLGWEEYPYDFITETINVPGHHFDLFTERRISETTCQIKRACDMLASDSEE